MLSPEELAGKKVGDFVLEQYIARGAMGMVFRARDTTLDRTVALKLIPKEGDQYPGIVEARKRLIKEARAAGLLTHPNIVTIHSYGETGEFQYICMEYVRGKTLAEVLDEKHILSVEDVLAVFQQILLALDVADGNGIVHRDIKPTNIMITDEGQVKVMDFGIATLPSLAMTMPGTILGTPFYMSPEQISGKKVDCRSDIFSLGAVLYQTLTGHKPFEGDGITAVAFKIMQSEPTPPGSINHSVPENLARVIGKALAKDPDNRYQNPKQMLADLKEVRTADIGFDATITAGDYYLQASLEEKAAASIAVIADKPGQDLPDEQDEAEDGITGLAGTRMSAERLDGDASPVLAQSAGKKSSRGLLMVLVGFLVLCGGVLGAMRFLDYPPSGSKPADAQKKTTGAPEVVDPGPAMVSKPQEPTVSMLLARARDQMAIDRAGARKLLSEALARPVQNSEDALMAARLFAFDKNIPAAIEYYQAALRLNPKSPDVLLELGTIFMEQGNYNQAIVNFQSSLALSTSPKVEVLTSMGICYYRINDHAQAKAFLSRVLVIDPANDQAKAYLSKISGAGVQPTSTTTNNLSPPSAPSAPSPPAESRIPAVPHQSATPSGSTSQSSSPGVVKNAGTTGTTGTTGTVVNVPPVPSIKKTEETVINFGPSQDRSGGSPPSAGQSTVPPKMK
jgi:tetratricopeptide (TPR) repeat protein/predicted Ser/Thr protein kinase